MLSLSKEHVVASVKIQPFHFVVTFYSSLSEILICTVPQQSIPLKNVSSCFTYLHVSVLRCFIKFSVGFFFLSEFSFTTIHESQDCTGKGGGHFFNSSLPLPPVSQTFRYQSGNYCRELSSAHRKQPHLNWKPGFRAQVAYH